MGENVLSTQLLSPGDTLAGKYRIDRIIGQGGMGVVYEAFHIRLRQRVAIKMLLPQILVFPEFVSRFEREARAAATLESRNVAKVIDVDTSPQGLPYMVIEYLEGNDLGEELTRRGRLPIEEAVALVMEACMPIAQAHAQGIIHRDLKPSNLFLAKKDGQQVLKLLDFGISKILTERDSKETSSLQGLGTPHYMSPEQVRRASDVDRRSDIWSLGIILYELLTGTEPFSGPPVAVIAAIVADPVPPPRTRRPDIPVALEQVIMRALEKDLRKRYADVRTLMTDLAPFAGEEQIVPMSVAYALPAPHTVPPHAKATPAAPPAPAPPASVASLAPTFVLKPPRPRWVYAVIAAPALMVLIFGIAFRAGRANVADAAMSVPERPKVVATPTLPDVPPPPTASVAPVIIAPIVTTAPPQAATHVPLAAHSTATTAATPPTQSTVTPVPSSTAKRVGPLTL